MRVGFFLDPQSTSEYASHLLESFFRNLYHASRIARISHHAIGANYYGR